MRRYGLKVQIGRTALTWWPPLDLECWTSLSEPRSYGFGIWIVRRWS